MREPFWGDYVLIAVTMQIASALLLIVSVLWSARTRTKGARSMASSFAAFLFCIWCGLAINIVRMVLFVSGVASPVLKQFVFAAIGIAIVTAFVSVWVLYDVLRTEFRSTPETQSHAEPPG